MINGTNNYDDGFRQFGQYYAYTVKDNRIDCTDYKPFFDSAEKQGCSFYTKFKEFDSKGKAHYHGIIFIPKKVYRKSLCLHGLHLKIVEMFDKEGWQEYCMKDQLIDEMDNQMLKPIKKRIGQLNIIF